MFDQLLKRLLQGEFICEVSDEAGFRYLQDPENAAQVDAFLTRLDYRLSSTQNRLAFFAAYRTIDNSARSDIRKVFYQFRIELQPVVEWLDMMMSCLNQDTALSPGDTLSFSGCCKSSNKIRPWLIVCRPLQNSRTLPVAMIR